MRITYDQLIDDHLELARLADRVLAEAASASPHADELGHTLHQLATRVRDHISVESRIVEQCADKPMNSTWRAVWTDGAAAFGILCRDWQAFLDDWSGDAIIADMAGFKAAAEPILGRLNDRLAAETNAFYASGLQFGGIQLR